MRAIIFIECVNLTLYTTLRILPGEPPGVATPSSGRRHGHLILGLPTVVVLVLVPLLLLLVYLGATRSILEDLLIPPAHVIIPVAGTALT